MRFDPNGPNTQFNTTPLLFGFRAQDLAADRTRTPGLADSHFHAVFVNSAPAVSGAAQPVAQAGPRHHAGDPPTPAPGYGQASLTPMAPNRARGSRS